MAAGKRSNCVSVSVCVCVAGGGEGRVCGSRSVCVRVTQVHVVGWLQRPQHPPMCDHHCPHPPPVSRQQLQRPQLCCRRQHLGSLRSARGVVLGWVWGFADVRAQSQKRYQGGGAACCSAVCTTRSTMVTDRRGEGLQSGAPLQSANASNTAANIHAHHDKQLCCRQHRGERQHGQPAGSSSGGRSRGSRVPRVWRGARG